MNVCMYVCMYVCIMYVYITYTHIHKGWVPWHKKERHVGIRGQATWSQFRGRATVRVGVSTYVHVVRQLGQPGGDDRGCCLPHTSHLVETAVRVTVRVRGVEVQMHWCWVGCTGTAIFEGEDESGF